MMKKFIAFLVLSFLLAGTAAAQTLPGYYPKDGFQRTGHIDAVHLSENRIVVDDISYYLSDSVVVRSLSSPTAPIQRLRKGAHVAFRSTPDQALSEIWLLPDNYKPRQRR
jgi:hypothetical protein